jgi:hypothetical protein
MNLSNRVLLPGILGLLLVFSLTTSAQWDKKPYAEWSDKDAQKVLNDSPWGRTQVYTSPLTMFRSGQSSIPGNTARPGSSNGQQTAGAPPDATHVNFRVRFLSAKPIRQAFSRMIEIQQKKGAGDELTEQLKQFASGEFLEYIIIAVTCDSQDPGANVQEASSLLRTRGTADLKNSTFLEIKGGKRIFLQEFQPPHQDGFGARFIFPRLVDGQPFITPESEEIHFFTELSGTYKLDRRFKVKDMMYEGKLEF